MGTISGLTSLCNAYLWDSELNVCKNGKSKILAILVFIIYWNLSMYVVQWIFDLSMFDLRKFFDLRKNFTVPKILVHKMFDLRKISRTPFFDLRKETCGFSGEKGNFWFRNSQILQTLIFCHHYKQHIKYLTLNKKSLYYWNSLNFTSNLCSTT